MKNYTRFAGAAAPAWKSLCLLVVWMGLFGAAVAGAKSTEPSSPAACTGPDVYVYALSAWQSAHPTCTVYAETAACGTAPDIDITGSSCYPDVGTVDIANVVVEDASISCYHTYLVKSVDGAIEVVLVDP